MFVWHFEKYTFFKGEVYCYMKVGALDFYLLFKLDMLIIIWVHYTALKLSNDFNKGQSPSNGKLSDFSFYIDS